MGVDSCLCYAGRSNYEVAELTWENGQLAMHGLGPPRPTAKPLPTSSASHSKYAWVDKPRSAAPANAAPSAAGGGGGGTGTLECIVNQAAALPRRKLPFDAAAAADLVPWFDHSRGSSAAASATMTMDALVPCAGAADDRTTAHFVDSAPPGGGGGVVGCSTRVGSCSGAAAGPAQEEDALAARKRAKGSRAAAAAEWSGMDQSVSGSATFGRDIGAGMTSTSLGSPENTSSGQGCGRATAAAAAEDHDSACHSRPPVREHTVII